MIQARGPTTVMGYFFSSHLFLLVTSYNNIFAFRFFYLLAWNGPLSKLTYTNGHITDCLDH